MKSAKRTWLTQTTRTFPVTQIFNLLYRRITFRRRSNVDELPALAGARSINNLGRRTLRICAVAFSAMLAGGALFCGGLSIAQEPAPTTPPAEEQPAAKPISPEQQQALVEDTNKTPVIPNVAEEEERPWRGRGNRAAWSPPMVVIGRDAVVQVGDSVEALVVIGGNGTVHGRVREAAVAVGGNLEIDGQVGQEAVAVLGNITANKGARVRGDAVAVGGRVNVAEGASVPRPQGIEFPDITWLRKWFVQCVLLMRPLSLKVTWVWFIAAVFLGLYIVIAALFPRPVRACIGELTARPATTFCMGLLTILLLPLGVAILIVTGVGILVVPFVLAATLFGALIGRVALLEWMGLRLGHQFGAQSFNHPVGGLLIGAALVAALYLVPFLGLLTFAIVSLWSLGGAVTAAFGSLRREMPEKTKPVAQGVAQASAAVPAMGAPVEPTLSTPEPALSAPQAAPQNASFQASPSQPFTPVAPPVVPEILTYPKARFWERLGAAVLDVILVIIVCVPLHVIWPVVILGYFSGLWTWRGTTVGGIVVGLKVVRVDGQPLTFPVALIRSLAAAFSVFVGCLGYLWIAWDSEKQGWHDKIAGTVVLRLPRGTPLV